MQKMKYTKEDIIASLDDTMLQNRKRVPPNNAVCAKDISKSLGCSLSTATRILSDKIKDGWQVFYVKTSSNQHVQRYILPADAEVSYK